MMKQQKKTTKTAVEKTEKTSEQIIMRRLILCELHINRESEESRGGGERERKGMQNQNKKINNK